ncbi:MAG: type VI secretion system contractile sheath large subunit [Myxococcota bacterium]
MATDGPVEPGTAATDDGATGAGSHRGTRRHDDEGVGTAPVYSPFESVPIGAGDAAPPIGATRSTPPPAVSPGAETRPAVPAAVALDEIEASSPSSAAATPWAELMATTGIAPDHTAFAEVENGLRHAMSYVIQSGQPLDVVGVDLLIAEITERMTGQIDAILHHPTFQALEAAWRGLKFVVDRVDFRENIRVAFVNVSKDDLLEDFEDSVEVPKSGMYKTVYSEEFGQFGGRPWGLVIANYAFTPSPRDMALLDACASVASMAHAPFVASAAPGFFGLEDWRKLPQMAEIAAHFEGPQFTKWRSFRDSEDARYVGLCLPRFLLRRPYGPNANRVAAFEYEEGVQGHRERYLWGNAAFAFATRVAAAFARYRWCVNIVGPSSGGTVEDLPLHQFDALGRIQTKVPTEMIITERREFEISNQGFIPFTYRPDTLDACFLSANSAQRPKTFGISEEGRRAELNHRLGTQLPYLFMSCRLAHYIKVLQRENIGTWKERQDLERELQAWIGQYVAKQAVVSASVRARRPLRDAKITVDEVKGNAGFYKVDMKIQPHFRYMGAVFHLGLVGRLDQDD